MSPTKTQVKPKKSKASLKKKAPAAKKITKSKTSKPTTKPKVAKTPKATKPSKDPKPSKNPKPPKDTVAKAKPAVTSQPQGVIATPEMEIIRRESDRSFGGRRISSVEVLNNKILVPPLKPAEFKKTLMGVEIVSVSRVGMTIVFEMPKKIGMFAVSLGGGGQIRRHTAKDKRDPATVLVLKFTKGGQMRLNSYLDDLRIHLLKPDSVDVGIKEIRGFGMDLVEAPMPWVFFLRRVREQMQDRSIKELLLDPAFIIGLGDVYCDEILYKCGLKYNTKLRDITDKKIKLLLQASVETIYEATKHRGMTLADGYFCDLEGNRGGFQNYLQIYGRDGERTPFSLHPIEKRKFQNRWTYFAPEIQF